MLIVRIALYYILAVVCFLWGAAAVRYGVFPGKHLVALEAEVAAFVAGDVDENLTLTQKLENDLGLSPERQMRSFRPAEPVAFATLEIDGLQERREAPRMRLSPDAPEAYRLLAGGFDFQGAFWGAILLDPEGRVAHRWAMPGRATGMTETADVLMRLYGLAFLADGSAIYSMQESLGGLVKIDRCSEVLWTKPGIYHHTVSLTEDGRAFWTFGGGSGDLHPTLLLIDSASGETLREIDMAAVEDANPDLFIFDLRREGDVEHGTHPNDIEPLSGALAPAFPGFEAGDLLVNYHNTNLVFVLDPESLEVKWWYVGAGDGAHDPDWQPDGTITLFNNNYRADRRDDPFHSTIVVIDPVANRHSVLLDGVAQDFYSRTNGHHLVTATGTILVTSSTQGRVFEVDPASGEILFDFVNAYDWDAGRTLHTSESYLIEAAQAERWIGTGCATEQASVGD